MKESKHNAIEVIKTQGRGEKEDKNKRTMKTARRKQTKWQ